MVKFYFLFTLITKLLCLKHIDPGVQGQWLKTDKVQGDSLG